jgi:hypothetical protein
MNWITERVTEPSTWAGLAAGCIIISMATGIGWIAIIGIIGAAAAMVLREKGII